MDFSVAQKLVWDNKVEKGFNITDVPLEMCFLQREISEFFTAWYQKLPDAGEELADAAIFLLGLAQLTGFDLNEEVQRKIEKNTKRTYSRVNGVLIKDSTDN